MAFNKYMHPRNIYKNKKPDFKALAIKYPEFREQVIQDVTGKVYLDFKKPESLRALTKYTLKEDFKLEIDLPLDRLIPTIPLRLNYLLWLEDIIGQNTPTDTVIGIDVGAGASCVYPLLGSTMNGWSFLATEADDKNYEYATKNVLLNNMEKKIKVRKASHTSMLSDIVASENNSYSHFDFCMCNPPFYSNSMEAQGLINTKNDSRTEPRSISTASESECISLGGELKFVERLIQDSLKLATRIRVYTSMLGKKSSLLDIKKYLLKNKIQNYSSTEFCQGNTMRWGIAWSFDKTITFPKPVLCSKQKEKAPIIHTVPKDCKLCSEYTPSAIVALVQEIFTELKIKYIKTRSLPNETGLRIAPTENTWSHQRRKRRQHQRKSSDSLQIQDDSGKKSVSYKEHIITTGTKRKTCEDHDDSEQANKVLRCESNVLGLDTCSATDAAVVGEASFSGPDQKFPKSCITNTMDTHSVQNKETTQTCSSSAACDSRTMQGDSVKQDPLFSCYLNIKKTQNGLIVLEMKAISEEKRELMHQLLQFFKNKFI